MKSQKRSIKFYRKNEEATMEMLGLTPTKNSGAGWIEKEDGYNEHIIAQLKSTDKQSISVNLLDLHKLEYHAIVEHKIPVFMIQFLETGELFCLVKPSDLPSVSEYLQTGSYNVRTSTPIDVEPDSALDKQPESKPKVVSSSKSRQKFWDEKAKNSEKEQSKWRKKLKSR